MEMDKTTHAAKIKQLARRLTELKDNQLTTTAAPTGPKLSRRPSRDGHSFTKDGHMTATRKLTPKQVRLRRGICHST